MAAVAAPRRPPGSNSADTLEPVLPGGCVRRTAVGERLDVPQQGNEVITCTAGVLPEKVRNDLKCLELGEPAEVALMLNGCGI